MREKLGPPDLHSWVYKKNYWLNTTSSFRFSISILYFHSGLYIFGVKELAGIVGVHFSFAVNEMSCPNFSLSVY